MNNDLKKYIKSYVFPEYYKNDNGHGIEHINYVINRCLKFSNQYEDINLDMLYTAAAYHDIAHHIDKKNHEKLSAKIFYENNDMKKFFTEEQRIIIKEGIEDHRASSNNIPRNDYGKILSSADRSTDVNEFLKRTHYFTLKHNPDLTIEQMIERAHSHTKDKYGKDGYAKSYVVDEEYNIFKNKIEELINNKEKFKLLYIKLNKF